LENGGAMVFVRGFDSKRKMILFIDYISVEA
jgi:hypothetical protein